MHRQAQAARGDDDGVECGRLAERVLAVGQRQYGAAAGLLMEHLQRLGDGVEIPAWPPRVSASGRRPAPLWVACERTDHPDFRAERDDGDARAPGGPSGTRPRPA